MAQKPTITIPEGAQVPAEVEMVDEIVGTGTQARKGNMVAVHYVGVAWSTGAEFDSSWDRNQTFAFTIGQGQVIPGWDLGIAGMKVGGRRRLTIPAKFGYGGRGAGGVIKPHENLVFVVDLLDVR